MRKLVYVLSDGALVNTMDEAKASGQRYTTKMIEIIEPCVNVEKMEKSS